MTSKPILAQCSISMTPEKVRKPTENQCFQGVRKWNIRLKWVNEDIHILRGPFSFPKSEFLNRYIFEYFAIFRTSLLCLSEKKNKGLIENKIKLNVS